MAQERELRHNAHRSSSSRSGAGGSGGTVADTHPGAYTKAQRCRTVLCSMGPDLRRPGPQILPVFLRDRSRSTAMRTSWDSSRR